MQKGSCSKDFAASAEPPRAADVVTQEARPLATVTPIRCRQCFRNPMAVQWKSSLLRRFDNVSVISWKKRAARFPHPPHASYASGTKICPARPDRSSSRSRAFANGRESLGTLKCVFVSVLQLPILQRYNAQLSQ